MENELAGQLVTRLGQPVGYDPLHDTYVAMPATIPESMLIDMPNVPILPDGPSVEDMLVHIQTSLFALELTEVEQATVMDLIKTFLLKVKEREE